MTIKSKQHRRGGFTLIEMTLSLTVLAVLARVLIGASDSIGGMTETGNIEARIHRASENAMKWIMRDLRNSGFQEVNGRDYPHILLGGVGTAGFEAYTYVPAPSAATAGDPAFGPTQGIVLCVPSDFDGNGRPEMDADGDGTPELDGNGDGVTTDSPADVAGIWSPADATIHADTRLVWGHDDIKYVVIPGPTGENELVRLVRNGLGGRRVIARSIDRIQFDTLQSAGGAGFAPDAVRVRIFYRATDAEGHTFRSRSEAIVRLKNNDSNKVLNLGQNLGQV